MTAVGSSQPDCSRLIISIEPLGVENELDRHHVGDLSSPAPSRSTVYPHEWQDTRTLHPLPHSCIQALAILGQFHGCGACGCPSQRLGAPAITAHPTSSQEKTHLFVVMQICRRVDPSYPKPATCPATVGVGMEISAPVRGLLARGIRDRWGISLDRFASSSAQACGVTWSSMISSHEAH